MSNIKRLDWVLTNFVNVSRKEAKQLIQRKKVYVNDILVTKIVNIDLEQDKIRVNDYLVGLKQNYYFVMNKPKDYVCANYDDVSKTVFELMNDFDSQIKNLHTVGRLDKDTTGLLIITNNGEFSHQLTSPKKHLNKTYKVTVDKQLSVDLVHKFAQEIILSNGEICRPSELTILDDYNALLSINEGKYHQVKRMFASFGYKVIELDRQKIGKLDLATLDLKIGEYRELTNAELELLKNN
ncbi:pseudouridine synthase [Mycoplasma hafezii]|uniref:16S rRNA pseudouridine(516) synthase n=1 Tax=Mycoplasma hafezii TaxID=525886 RepID=UPI003CEFDC40